MLMNQAVELLETVEIKCTYHQDQNITFVSACQRFVSACQRSISFWEIDWSKPGSGIVQVLLRIYDLNITEFRLDRAWWGTL